MTIDKDNVGRLFRPDGIPMILSNDSIRSMHTPCSSNEEISVEHETKEPSLKSEIHETNGSSLKTEMQKLKDEIMQIKLNVYVFIPMTCISFIILKSIFTK